MNYKSPLSPAEIVKASADNIPEAFIEAINLLLIQNASFGKKLHIAIKQKDIISLYERRSGLAGPKFNLSWLNFESLYKQYGWNVVYFDSSYKVAFDAYYVFTES